MSRGLKRRLVAAERQLNPAAPEITVIIVEGGLPEPSGFAEAGVHKWTRAPDETFDTFRARVVAAAEAAGEKFVCISGLPDPREFYD